ncbi:MAG: DnaB-like helicase C-terminal domain-containing protein [Devosia sp.]|nr:DnaB-like helicase C-terminal domain-containing protein [Devosia sp.]
MSEVVETGLPCPSPICGSSDAYALYDDGHGHCFSCSLHVPGDRAEAAPTPAPKKKGARPLLAFGHYQDLAARGISEDTCQKYGYFVTEDDKGSTVQVAPYRNKAGQIAGQKVRGAGKKFFTTGDFDDLQLFGQHLARTGGKRIVITEGEIDALSGAQMLGTWPVVSIPNGAQGAAKAIRNNIEFLESYEAVIFCFDMDEPGRAAAEECAAILTPGKAFIMELPVKDANEMLQANEVKAFVTAFWEARSFKPGGIINGTELWDSLNAPVLAGIDYPWPKLTEMLLGQRDGELVTWTSGSGMGKSTAVSEIAYARLMQGHKVGYVALEENVRRTAQRMVGLNLNKPIHLPGNEVSPDALKAAFDATLGTGRFFTFDHFGSIHSDSILDKIRYLAKGCGCKKIILDHLSIIVSGMEDNEDERKTIDQLMTRLRSLVEETGVSLDLVSHLRRPNGDKGHEQGAEVSLSHLRGSHSIVQLSDAVVAMERNQQSDEDGERDVAMFRVLKNRFVGITGPAGYAKYDRVTGRMLPFDPEVEELSHEEPSDF